MKIYPVTLGRGKRLFPGATIPAAFELTECTFTPIGVVAANYARAGAIEPSGRNDLLERWLTVAANVEDRLGGAYELFWRPDDRENDSTIGCRVTAIAPGRTDTARATIDASRVAVAYRQVILALANHPRRV